MALPKQIEEAAELAEELHGRMYGTQPEAEVEQPAAQEASEDMENTSEEEQGVEEEVEANEVDVPHDDELEELRKFKSRYLSLKGKYDAEVPRLQHELKDLKTSVFERLEQSIAQKQQPEPAPKAPENEKLTQFKEEYGEDFVETLRLLIQKEAEDKIKSSLQPVQEQVTSVEDTQIKAAQQSFAGYLDDKVNGDWRSLWDGADPNFLEFLQKPDPSGLYTYADLVQQYNNNWDADRLSKVFNVYIDSITEPEAPKKEATPNPAKTAMVAPSRSTQHATPAASDKLVWTKDTIKEFELNDRRGKYTPEVSKSMWDDLLSAMAENRIR